MLLHLSRIREAHDRLDRTYPPSAFEKAQEFAVVEPVCLSADVHKDKAKFRLVGRAATTLELTCGRCLEPFRLPLDAAFDLRYVPHAQNVGDGERSVEEDDLGTAYYRDDVIDLGELLREQFYLALPMKPLCNEECRGLCPQCGTNLNRATCDCTREWQDPRLAVLKAFLKE
jgi:uncharacterized protein